MTSRKGHNHVLHTQRRPARGLDCDQTAMSGKTAQLESSFGSDSNSTMFRNETARARRSTSLQGRSRSSSFQVSFVLRMGALVSCMEQYRSEQRMLVKPSDHLIGSTNKCSVHVSLMSRGCFGPQKQRQTSHPSSDAQSALLSFGSLVSATGLAMRSPRSSKKFSSVTACATCA